MTDTQRQIARKLVKLLLEQDYMLSVWNGTWFVLTNSTKTDDVLAAIEQLNGFVSIEIDPVHQAGQHEPYLGNIDLTWSTTKPDIDITYNGPNLAEPFIEAIIDEVMEFAANLTAEATS